MVSTMTFYFVLVATVLVSVAAQSSGTLRVQRETPPVGAEEEQDANDPKYKYLAREAYDKYEYDHEIAELYSVRSVSVKFVTRQLDAELDRYHLYYVVDRVNILGQSDRLICNSKVEEELDYQKEFITKCGKPLGQSRGMRQKVGGEEIRDPNDPEYMKLAEESYEKYLKNKHSNYPSGWAKNIVVKRATIQVVSGSLKRIDFLVITFIDQRLICHSEVWEQLWLDKKDIKVNCNLIY